MTPRRRPTRILLLGNTRAEIETLLPLANHLNHSRRVPVTALGLVIVPAPASLSAGARAVQQLRALLSPPPQPGMRVLVRVTRDPIAEVRRIVQEERFGRLLVQTSNPLVADLLRASPCDVIALKGKLPEAIAHILLPIRGGPYAALSLEVALALAQACAADITVLHATPRPRDPGAIELLQHLETLPEVTGRLRVRGDAASVILEQSRPQKHQLLIMGGAAHAAHTALPVGPVVGKIFEQTTIPMLIVKTAEGFPERSPADASMPPVDYTISVIVDKWFAENTFHAHEFEDIAELVALKEKQGLTISLGLPTLNEEKTIGNVVRMMRQRFMRDFSLLDEIVVIDSNSTDRTVAIAEHLGVPVVKHPEVLTRYGSWAGKGEALWDSLYVLSGDLIAWIDTDIINIHPRFVYGILGPLIREPRLMYVKGFYQRPLRLGSKLQARGGGRVTELVARPLFNLFYPELSGFVQPLAGEYAGRRRALEQVPFFVGYGVETGLLIDLWTRFGLQAMGQVDLEERVHRNQSLSALSKMAFEITQVFMQRVGESREVEIVNPLNRSMKLIQYETDAFELQVADVQIRERPPIITIPEYRALRHAQHKRGRRR